MAQTDVTKVSILGKDSIHCGFHLVPYIVDVVLRTLKSSTYVLVTDSVVASFHLKSFQDEFSSALKGKDRVRFLYLVIPPGETSKSRQGKADVEDFLLENKCTRDTVILALGGGVIGDLAGFVAATFMRGVRFCQIPTTLLAMVDSSVGGKTAIDTPHGKNLIGAFWQPEYIFIDAALLETLPSREFSNGMAEVVKTAAIWDESEFSALESQSEALFSAIQTPSQNNAGRSLSTRSPEQQLLLRVISASIGVKAHIVTIDERETGLRNLVNFGHTIGHAIEAVLTPTILHGECVSVGMILEAEVARQMGVLGQVAVGRLTRALKAYNLPTSLSDPRIARVPSARLLKADRLLDVMALDKKNAGAEKKVVLLSRIGATHEQKASIVPDAVIRRSLCDAVRVVASKPNKSPVTMSTPGSKSISNRALLLAALGDGTCRLKNLLHSDDTQVMMNALIDLNGAQFTWEDGGETLVVEGGKGKLRSPATGKEIYLGNAGTAARFLTTVCTLAQSSAHNKKTYTTITGNARMKQRPVGPLVDALRSNGSSVDFVEGEGCLPLRIGAGDGLKGGRIQLAASVSSQYVSSILLCAPYAAQPVELELTGGTVISQPYIDMTLAMMRTFGVNATRHADPQTGKLLDVYTIPNDKPYSNPAEYAIESDASSATYPLAVAAITGTTCTLKNIGSDSLQGDAMFAKAVLEPMGCTVKQTRNETIVTGPPVGGLKALGEIDMEPMTDAFLTASVLAAVAASQPKSGRELADRPQTTTRITGIANQRVKECNRIKAMMDQLAKFGVETRELDDGLEIYGRSIQDLRHGCSMHCYDDHRVAMAFSVLGTVVDGTILEEKRCVEKTWPNWWDDLENKIGLRVEGVELDSASAHGSSSPLASEQSTVSVVLIGMRGSGKTFVGKLAAQTLGFSFIDADAEFEAVHKTGVKQFVQSHGWPAFREAETQILKDILSRHHLGFVISLGGGIVESSEARRVLKAYGREKGPVVHIKREIDEVVKYLGEETARPAYGEPVTDVFRRREPWFAECSTYEFINYTGVLQQGNSSNVSTVGPNNAGVGFVGEIQRFFGHITGTKLNFARNVSSDKRSYFLSLTYPDVTPALPHIDELTGGADAIEVRVDLLRSPKDEETRGNYIPPPSYIVEQLATLRQRTSLPIVFTVRSGSQGGSHPDSAEDEAFQLYDLGVRLGCEYIDVELGWNEAKIREFIKRKGRSMIIASWHDWSGKLKWDGQEVKRKYTYAADVGDIVKIVGKAVTTEDNFALLRFVSSMDQPEAKPFIAINTGYEGQMSRILNRTLSPITHPLMTSKAAPGQLSFRQVQNSLHLLGMLPQKRFYLFGSPIKSSPSPTLHNTGFSELGLPYTYDLYETAEVDDKLKQLVLNPDFGGASVTIPHKLSIIPLLSELTPEATAIGAVNTIICQHTREGSRRLIGDNTDWIGIRNCIKAKLRVDSAAPKIGLVIGAGGTSRAALYALHSMGLECIYLFNRTKSSAMTLVSELPQNYNVTILDSLDSFPEAPPSIVISTIPGAATSTTKESSGDFLALPPTLFVSQGGVAVDLAYRPPETALLSMAAATDGWSVVRGVDILLEQGYAQFELWTGRRCPRKVVAEHVLGKYHQARNTDFLDE